MTDQTNTPPDSNLPNTITWSESGIIIKQIVMIVVAVGSLAGIAFTPEQTAQITGIVSAVAVIGFSAWTIHNRATKNCPPVVPKAKT